MKRAVLLSLLLAGCSHKQPEIREVPVPVPTPIHCVDPANIPDEPPTVGHRFNGDAKHDLQILAPSARALRQWGQDLRAMLEACVIKEPGEEAAAPETAGPDAADPASAEPPATEVTD